MYQFYILEIQQYDNGEYGHIVHFAYDENLETARNKAESKYYSILSAAAISGLQTHSVVLISTDGCTLMHNCYHHAEVHNEDINNENNE